MKPPKTINPAQIGRRVRFQKIKSFCNAPIITDSRALRQALPTKNTNFTNLVGKVRDERLTESLEILEQQGFTGDLALFFVAVAQEVAV